MRLVSPTPSGLAKPGVFIIILMIENLQLFLSREFLGNTYLSYCYAVFSSRPCWPAFISSEIVFKNSKPWPPLMRRTRRPAIELIATISPLEYQLIALYIALRHLQRTPGFDKVLSLVILDL